MPNGADEELEEDNQGYPSQEETDTNIVEDPIELSVRASNNKLFQARLLLEKNSDVYGAEIILFDKNAEEINRILITDETQFDSFNAYITNMNKAYIPYTVHDVEIVETLSNNSEDSDEYVQANSEWSDLSKKKDLKTILENGISLTNPDNHIQSYLNSGQSIINATHLNGFDSANFSKPGHTHDERYLTPNHSTVVGMNGKLGHLTLVDNLTTNDTAGGQVLSAKQGKNLNDRLKNVEDKFKWKKVQWGQSKYVTYHVNEDLHLVALDYTRKGYKGFKKETGTQVLGTAFPYHPTQICYSSLYRGDVTIWINTTGSIKIRSLTKIDELNINAQLLYYYK